MSPLFQTIHQLEGNEATLRKRRFGVIEMVKGRLAAVHLRPWPKTISVSEIWWFGRRAHRRIQDDRCLLYYEQPRRLPNFLTVNYVVSNHLTSFRTMRGCGVVLDEIARIKHTDAMVCVVSNRRISDRLMTRWGWERHVLKSRRRHYIKRFYGEYPDLPDLATYVETGELVGCK